jgi:Fe-Mn family superoxide dismutase
MTIHHTKHHNTYITNLNTSLAKLDASMITGDISGIVILQNAIKFNGGGHINHSLFWENLTPEKNEPSGSIEIAIRESFGDYETMKEKLTSKTVAIQGSGWGWLAYDKMTGKCIRLPKSFTMNLVVYPCLFIYFPINAGALDVATCANQDPLLATTGLVPLMGIDVWEHAYYVE